MSPTGRKPKADSPGFTLLELVVVLVILGLVISLVIPRFQNALTGGDMRLATRMIIGEIRRFRGDAARTRTTRTMVLHIDDNALYSLETALVSQPGSEGVGYAEEKKYDYRELPQGVHVEDVVVLAVGKKQEGEARIRFFANGTVDRSLIHLRNETDEVYTLEINPFTGNVLIHDRYVDQKVIQEGL
jgi:prepilin-type N-terminal cleavage/methylation domain-containing protein